MKPTLNHMTKLMSNFLDGLIIFIHYDTVSKGFKKKDKSTLLVIP